MPARFSRGCFYEMSSPVRRLDQHSLPQFPLSQQTLPIQSTSGPDLFQALKIQNFGLSWGLWAGSARWIRKPSKPVGNSRGWLQGQPGGRREEKAISFSPCAGKARWGWAGGSVPSLSLGTPQFSLLRGPDALCVSSLYIQGWGAPQKHRGAEPGVSPSFSPPVPLSAASWLGSACRAGSELSGKHSRSSGAASPPSPRRTEAPLSRGCLC